MSESIYSDLQNPVRGCNLVDPEVVLEDQIPPDPLLGTGWFIGADQKVDNAASEAEKPAPAETSARASATPVASAAIEVTPLSQRRPRRPVEEMAERPDWLPDDWKIEVRVRTSGATAGTSDRYYFSPSGLKFRSKVEVLQFLETGSRRKRKLKSDADATPSGGSADQKRKTSKQPSSNPSDHQKKKSKSNIRDFSDIKFDFRNPPRSVTWVQTDDCPDDWRPISSNATVPESEKTEWGNFFLRVTQLDKTNGAS